LQRVVPVLRTADYPASRRFYVDALGFEVDWEWRHEPGFPVFAQISRAGLSLYLSEHRDGEHTGRTTSFLYVSDVDAWHRDVLEAGLEVASEPRNQPWGNREMSVLDPDGNTLVIATVLVGRRDPS
jgi:catechol 2,3-dioxygenase-like lactoylglutathione lyase family enzyme